MPAKKKKANVRGNKGGCKVGRKEESPNGGCKVGKRNPNTKEKSVATAAAKKGSAPKKPVKKAKAKSAPIKRTVGGYPAKSKAAAAIGVKAGDRLPFKKKAKKAKKSEPTEYKRKVKVGTSDRTTRSTKPKGVPDRIKAKVAKLGKDQAKMKRKVGRRIEKKAEFHKFEFAEDQIMEHHHPAYMSKHEKAEFPEGVLEDHLGYLHSESHSIAGTGGGYSKSRVGFRKSEDHPLVYSKQFQGNIDARKAKSKAKKATPKEPKYKYPTETYNIRDGEGGNFDEYAVHKGKVYKHFKFIGENRGQIDIAQPDIKDESVINKIKKLAPNEKLVRDKKKKGKAPPASGGKLPSRTKAVTETVLSGKGKDLPDLYKHGMGNAAKFELEAMLEKSKKDTAKELKAMKTAGKDYFTVKKVQGGTEYHTKAASAMAKDQERIQTRLKQYVASHGIRDAGVQEMIGKFNKFAKSAVGRARKTKMEALRRLGFID